MNPFTRFKKIIKTLLLVLQYFITRFKHAALTYSCSCISETKLCMSYSFHIILLHDSCYNLWALIFKLNSCSHMEWNTVVLKGCRHVHYHWPTPLPERQAWRIAGIYSTINISRGPGNRSVRTISARLTCEVSWKCHAQSDAGIFIIRFFWKNGKKNSVKFWDPWFHRVISDLCSNDSCYNG